MMNVGYRYKIEYYITNSISRQIKITQDRFSVIELLSYHNLDNTKDIKVFEEHTLGWKLVHRIVNKKTEFINYSELNEIETKKNEELLDRQQIITKLVECFDMNVCPNRLNSQNFMDIIFDAQYSGEDITKPKLSIIK